VIFHGKSREFFPILGMSSVISSVALDERGGTIVAFRGLARCTYLQVIAPWARKILDFWDGISEEAD
jgi:hypothetical protein